MENNSKIKCPNCQHEIDVQDVLAHQVEERLKQEFQVKLNAEKKKLTEEAENLQKEKSEFEDKKKKENEIFLQRVELKVKEEKEQFQKKIKAKLEEDQADQFEELQKELNEKSEKIKELNRSKAEIEKLKREKEELKEEIEADAQKKLTVKLSEAKEMFRKNAREENELAIKELQKQLEDQKKLTEQMKRKQEQGSMQMQGEVQEIAIEEWLNQNFPLDTIGEIKKGARGADCIQTVNTRAKQNCGTIYYESKRTKDFQSGWIEKFKNDIRDKGADIGVLVTDAMPSEMERMGLREGVWICSYEEFKGLSFVLRETIVQISNTIATQENKGDKMTMLYDFLTSTEFKLQIEGIVEGFTQMQKDLDSEKRSITGHWKKREKQIQKVLLNTNFMYNSIKGIAGNAIQAVPALELKENVEQNI